MLSPASHDRRITGAKKEAALHGVKGVRHYLRLLSQRGWGHFSILSLDPAAGTAEIKLDHSARVDEARKNAGRKLCYMFASWLEGALDYTNSTVRTVQPVVAREVCCEAEGEGDHCLFQVPPHGDTSS